MSDQFFLISHLSLRFAVILVVANPGNSSFLPSVKVTSDSVVEQVSKRIIDDEYAPTIFTFGQIFSKTKQNSATNNFWQWRTVRAYKLVNSLLMQFDLLYTELTFSIVVPTVHSFLFHQLMDCICL